MAFRLEPVDYDPFADGVRPVAWASLDSLGGPGRVTLEPVDYDPFAGSGGPGLSPIEPSERDSEPAPEAVPEDVDDPLLPAIGRGLHKTAVLGMGRYFSDVGTTLPGAALKAALEHPEGAGALAAAAPPVLSVPAAAVSGVVPDSWRRGMRRALDGSADFLLRVGKENRAEYDRWHRAVEQDVPEYRRGKDFLDDPGLLLNPSYLAESTAEAAGSMLLPVAVGLAGGGPVAAGLVGGSMEGLASLGEQLDKGVEPDEALVRSGAYAAASAALNAFSFGKMLDKRAVDGLRAKGAKILAASGWEGFTEWLEGPVQELAQEIGRLPVVSRGRMVGESAASGWGAKGSSAEPADLVEAVSRAAREEMAVIPGAALAGGGMHVLSPASPAPLPKDREVDLVGEVPGDVRPAESSPSAPGGLARGDHVSGDAAVSGAVSAVASQLRAMGADVVNDAPFMPTDRVVDLVNEVPGSLPVESVVPASRPFSPEEIRGMMPVWERPVVVPPLPQPAPVAGTVADAGGPAEQSAPAAPVSAAPSLLHAAPSAPEQGSVVPESRPFSPEEVRGMMPVWERPEVVPPLPQSAPAAGTVADTGGPAGQDGGAESVAASVEAAAREAALSPENDLSEPSPAQKEAGNYKKGHARILGMDVSIENPAGSERSGVDGSGREWRTLMHHHYGYIRGTRGADKDHLDVFLGPDLREELPVFVVDQVDPETGRFDEHKVMLGFADEAAARDAYLSNYEPGWNGLGAITAMPLDAFRDWARSRKTKKPVSEALSSGRTNVPASAPSPASFEDMVRAAARWKGAALNLAEALAGDKRAALRLSRQTTKGDLDRYLMRTFGVDEAAARNVSNHLTAENIPADRSADVADFAGEPWARDFDQHRKGEHVDEQEGNAGQENKGEPVSGFHGERVAEADGGQVSAVPEDNGGQGGGEAGLQPGAEEAVFVEDHERIDELLRLAEAPHEWLRESGLLTEAEARLVGETPADETALRLEELAEGVAHAEIVRDQALELHDLIVGRVRSEGGLNFDHVRERAGLGGVENLRSKFGFGFVSHSGRPLDVLALEMTPQVPEIEEDQDNLLALLMDSAKSKKTIRQEYRAAVDALHEEMKSLLSDLDERAAYARGENVFPDEKGGVDDAVDDAAGEGLERDGGPGAPSDAVGGPGVPADQRRAGEAGGGRRPDDGTPGAVADGDRGLSDGPSAAGGASGRDGVREGASGAVRGAAGSELRGRGRGDSGEGLASGRDGRGDAAEAAGPGAERRGTGQAAGKGAVKKGDAESIAATLPSLFAGQLQDVGFAERRFEKGAGVLFTNGTGTGKTGTGLGIVKRLAMVGKENVLIAVPSDSIANAWIAFARDHMDLEVTKLRDTRDAGRGVVVTTHANMAVNDALAGREWDLIIMDEAHKIMSSEKAANTRLLDSLRALSKHPGGYGDLARMRHPELHAAQSGNPDPETRDKWLDAREAVRSEVEAAAGNIRARLDAPDGNGRAGVVFLSATPFAYAPNVDYAEGFLFDYPEVERGGYNSPSGQQQFMIAHFGYRMRTGKLTRPEAGVDSGVMERQFNSWLKREGVLSSRTLDVEHDYDRRFVLVESAVGRAIDEGLEWLRSRPDMAAVRDKIEARFDYLSRRFLLEAIKAREAAPLIREHLALGRKVVVFHDFKKGGGFNPFDVSELLDSAEEVFLPDDGSGRAETVTLGELARRFREARPDLARLPLRGLSSPLVTLTQEFPDALVFNGDVPKGDRAAAIRQFQDDDSGRNLIIVQSAAGEAGISLHDTTGRHQRVLINLGLPTRPVTAIQQEGRIFRVGQKTNAMFRYLNTGTNWERWAFAGTIASRASTAENLSLGEAARALRDGFVLAFEESDAWVPGHEGEGTGGKERDHAANNALSEWDRAVSLYFAQQKKTARTRAAEGVDYYATPEPLGLKMVEWAAIEPGMDVLEPSAGHGAIARWFPAESRKTMIEPSAELASRVALVSDGRIVPGTFEALHAVNKYDAIVMNPPFGKGGKTAMDHVARAYTHLREGGRIVAVIPRGPSMDKRLDAWMDSDASKGARLRMSLDLPAVTFERAGTGVSTRVIVIDRVSGSGAVVPGPASGEIAAKTIREFFSAIENRGAPERVDQSSGRVQPESAAASGMLVPDQARHSKTGADLFVARKSGYVSDDAYKRLAVLAKKHGGWWSSFKGGGAVPGFQFKTRDARDAFLEEASGSGGPVRFARRPGRVVRAKGYDRTVAAVVDVIKTRGETAALVEREDLGEVTVDWGHAGSESKAFRDGAGLSHIIARRQLEGDDAAEVIAGVVRAITDGEVSRSYGGEAGRVDLTFGDFRAVLSRQRFGKKETWLLTGFRETSGAGGESSNPTSYAPVSSVSRTQAGADYVGKIRSALGGVNNTVGAGPFSGSPRRAVRRASARGMEVRAVERVVRDLTRSWENAPAVSVVRSVAELPDALLDHVRRSEAEGEVQAVYWDGRVYVVADRMAGAEQVRRTVLHEAVGHHGLRLIMPGGELERHLDLAWKSRIVQRMAGELAETYGLDLKDEAQRREAVEEVLAHMAEDGVESTALDRFVAAVLRAVRRVVPSLRLTLPEIRDLIGRARRTVADGGGGAGVTGAQARMSRDAGENNAETESARQYRETERVYGGRAAYDKARADGRTKLTYGQWVQVRTPNFKKWFGDWEAVANRKFLDGSPISVLTGEEFKSDGVPLTQKVPRWYAENGYSFVNVDGIGPVALDAVAVKHSLGHGIGRDKATAFAAVPDVLRGGRIIHREAMRASTGGMVYHVAAPIEIAGRPFVMDVLVKSDDNSRRMYVHEVALREKLQQSDFKVGAVAAKAGKRADADGAGVIRTVLQYVYGVNPSSVSKVVDPETGEPLVVYHGTSEQFSEFRYEKLGATTGSESSVQGFFFSDNPYDSGTYAALAFDVRTLEGAFDEGRKQYFEAQGRAKSRVKDLFSRTIGVVEDYSDLGVVLRKLEDFAKALPFSQDVRVADGRVFFGREVVGRVVKSSLGREYFSPERSGFFRKKFFEGIVGVLVSEELGVPIQRNFLAIRRPKVLDNTRRRIKIGVSAKRRPGTDGTNFRGVADPLLANHWIAYASNQIKSATGNSGAFDPENPDIRFSRKRPPQVKPSPSVRAAQSAAGTVADGGGGAGVMGAHARMSKSAKPDSVLSPPSAGERDRLVRQYLEEEDGEIPESALREMLSRPLPNSSVEPEVLLHDSSEKGEDFDVLPGKNDSFGVDFGGIFAGGRGGMGGNFRHLIIVDPDKIAGIRDRDLEYDPGILSRLVKKDLSEEEADLLWEYVTEQEHVADLGEEEFEEFQDTFGFWGDSGDVSWQVQALRGQVAKSQGWAGVKMEDETGVSTLVFSPARTIFVQDSNKPSASRTSYDEAFRLGFVMQREWERRKNLREVGASPGALDDSLPMRFKRAAGTVAALGQSMTRAQIAAELEKDRTFANRVHEGRDLARHQVKVAAQAMQREVQRLAGSAKWKYNPFSVLSSEKEFKDSARSRLLDAAMLVYRDMAINPAKADDFRRWAHKRLHVDKVKGADRVRILDQLKVLDAAANLTREQRDFVDGTMDRAFGTVGAEARRAGVVGTLLDNYVRRLWRRPEDDAKSAFAGASHAFRTFTSASRARTLETVFDGWMRGYDLQIKGITSSWAAIAGEIGEIVANKRFIQEGRAQGVFSVRQQEGYARLAASGMQVWVRKAGVKIRMSEDYGFLGVDGHGRRMFVSPPKQVWAVYAKPGDTRADTLFDNEREARDYAAQLQSGGYPRARVEFRQDVDIFERVPLYAPESIAGLINRMTRAMDGDSVWRAGLPGAILKFNAAAKAWILMTSFFHHLAGARSWAFAVNHGAMAALRRGDVPGAVRAAAEAMNPVGAHKRGLEKIRSNDATLRHLIRHGLVLGELADWSESMASEHRGLTERLFTLLSGRVRGAEKGLAMVRAGKFFRERAANSLFKRLFAGLKAEAASIEFAHWMQVEMQEAAREGRVPNADLVAERVAALVNSDFGGLHLGRMGRNPSVQAALRLLLLAPDWTESNWRTVTGVIPGLNEAIARSMGEVPGPPGMDRVFRRFWAGIILKGAASTLLVQMAISGLFGDDDDHWWDMYEEQFADWDTFRRMRWTGVDVTPIYRKLGMDVPAGERKIFSVVGHFADFLRLMDPESLVKGKLSPVARVAGALGTKTDFRQRPYTGFRELLETGQTVKRSHHHPVETFWDALPSIVLAQARDIQPIQVGYLLKYIQGEEDGLTALLSSAGAHMKTAYSPDVTGNEFRAAGREITSAYQRMNRLSELLRVYAVQKKTDPENAARLYERRKDDFEEAETFARDRQKALAVRSMYNQYRKALDDMGKARRVSTEYDMDETRRQNTMEVYDAEIRKIQEDFLKKYWREAS